MAEAPELAEYKYTKDGMETTALLTEKMAERYPGAEKIGDGGGATEPRRAQQQGLDDDKKSAKDEQPLMTSDRTAPSKVRSARDK